MKLFNICDEYIENYVYISSQEAKKIMDTEKDIVILDVRTQEEWEEVKIEGSILIAHYDLLNFVEKIILDKNKKILLYCRSGYRTKIAFKILRYLGYNNIFDFGGIIDWPYETVKSK
ncbi:MAG: rhodanese-like domain-containing protein [Oscillospiraceae bacterium]|nr:rhodanese-like domain-containing protein [Oscillospiraceae bacterium]